MATTTVRVTYAPDTKATLESLRSHVALLESLADVTVVSYDDMTIGIETDYSDNYERDMLVATWDV
jgi:hypothetical protein